MSSFRSLLVPTDFSAHADAAVERAAWIAEGSGATLHLFHACGVPVAGLAPYEFSLPAGTLDAMREAAATRLGEVAARLEGRGLTVTTTVSEGLPGDAIAPAVEARGADLVVLGTRGLTGLKHLLLGSVAERALRTAPCPVLAVKDDDPAGPFERILCAVDFSESSERALDLAAELAREYGAELHIVHAVDLPLTLMTPYEVAVPDGLIREAREAAQRKLDGTLERLRGRGLEAKGHLGDVPAAPAIADCASQHGADLLVLGTRGHTGLKHLLLGSVAERTIQLSPCSVLVAKGSPKAKS